MAKRESNFINMVVTLFAVTFIAAASLGMVNELTIDAIAKSNAEAQNKAIASVLPKYDKLGESYTVIPTGETLALELFPALDADGKEVGTAIKTYTKNGFSGLIEIMVGFTPDGEISGYQVLKHAETPGLGSKMQEWFSNADKPKQNIVGKNAGTTKLSVSKDGGDVDAITAATISSRAFLESIQRAYNTYTNSTDAISSATTQN